ncbi:hypothetical protein L3X38_015312 [Prunus dulcis]|uniref:Uncharacterized protein n=1 Tax=Prunus dulcis TaxID=3755 RepID=A0AAD4WPV7_PRUDU|nr:hypothetical protein L3X38_015312 [Prunus dulcis]
MVEAYFQPEQAQQRRALWPEVRSSGAKKGSSSREQKGKTVEPTSLANHRSTDDDDVLTIDALDSAPTEMEDSHPEAEDFLLLNSPINLIEFQHKSDDDDVLTIDDLDPAPTEMEDSHPEV